jgi:hypothetical protein
VACSGRRPGTTPGRPCRGWSCRPDADAGGYPAWTWNDQALLRAANFLYSKAGWPADANDSWQPWLLDYRYGRGSGPPLRATSGRTSAGPTGSTRNGSWARLDRRARRRSRRPHR